MVEQDYITRQIREIARVLAKILFNVDSETVIEDIEDRLEENEIWKELQYMIDEGNINDAENYLDDLLSEGDTESVQIALLFYSYLNEKSEDFLEGNGFSKEEVKLGMENVAEGLGLNGLTDIF